jgi:membrane dipeptidase
MKEDYQQKAKDLSRKYIITDGHIDLPWRLSVQNFRMQREFISIPVQSDEGDFDYVRAKAGGLSAPFMSIFIPASFQDDLPKAKAEADSLIKLVDDIIEAHPDKFADGPSPQRIDQNFKQGLISLPMGLENGAPIAALEDVDYFFEKGIRYVTLTHGKDNHICDSSYDTTRTWGGLSPYGKDLVSKMNASGMMIDVSHISDEAFFQVMDLSNVPVIASHSSCRVFTPGWARNMSDEMITSLAENGGVIQINFGSDFLDAEVARNRQQYRKELHSLLEKHNLKASDPEAKNLIEKFTKKHPALYADVEKVADHIDHVRNLVGVDHIGIGSDFDGVGDSLPTGLKDVSMYPNLIAELLERGYTEEEIRKICFANIWRVWNHVLETGGKA